MKLIKKLFFIFLIAFIAVVISYFARMNDQIVTLNLIFGSVKDIQLWLLSLFCFLAGVIFSVMMVFLDIIFMSGNERKLKKELNKLKSELAATHNEKFSGIDSETFEENTGIDENKSLPQTVETDGKQD